MRLWILALWVPAMAISVVACAGGKDDEGGVPGDEQDVKGKSFLADEGATCGGLAGIRCKDGLVCKGAPAFPDATGTCQKQCIQKVECGGTGHFDSVACACVPN